MNCQIIRSGRKTVGLEIGPEGLIVRAPYRMTQRQIEDFLAQHRRWIEKHLAPEGETVEKLGMEELRALGKQALALIPQRVAHYAPLVGVSYGRITIRNQRTRWGSCSSLGNLNFNVLLMLCPPEVLDSVVVHELCHLRHPNHGKDFYAEVLRVFPDYRACEAWLKQNGPALMRRLP